LSLLVIASWRRGGDQRRYDLLYTILLKILIKGHTKSDPATLCVTGGLVEIRKCSLAVRPVACHGTLQCDPDNGLMQERASVRGDVLQDADDGDVLLIGVVCSSTDC
jgi:hypothetical protein